MALYLPRGFGWLPATPDFRDFTPKSAPIADLLASLPADNEPPDELPPAVDLREYFLDVDDQLDLPTSSAHACAALVQYFERRAHGRVLRPARLMLHQNAVRMAGGEPAAALGVDLRSTLKAMIRCGVAPERHWPYEASRLAERPDAFLYSFRQPYDGLRYFRIDGRKSSGRETLDTLRALLSAGFPVCFGMSIPDSLTADGQIPYRPTFDRPLGGQALVVAGYDDRWLRGSRGALLIRSSWGSGWGDAGYGWLPYAYVEECLAVDFFTLLHPTWIDSGEFSAPRV
jgi:C1A family cysteine protease